MLGNHNNSAYEQKQLDAPVPWIGMYVALASLLCSLAMVADVFHGLRSKKLWFPCKYFPLNATSLTLLAVALKLPVDLTTNMWATADRLAKVSSLALMSTSMGNFMPSLGSMGDKEILMNVTALGILIITVIVDVCIHAVGSQSLLHHHVLLFPEEILSMILMLLLLVMLASSAIMVLTTKKYLEAKYQELHNIALNQEMSDMGVNITTDKLKALVKKYWVMAETSCPQFVIARSATCAAAGVVCLLNALILAEAQIRMVVVHRRISLSTASSYGFSTKWILLAQSIGVLAGTIAPAFRWCTAMSLRCSRSLKDELKVEAYWTDELKDWKGCCLASRIRHQKFRKLLHNAKGRTVNFFVRIQIFIVLSSKLLVAISSSVTGPFISFSKFIKYLKMLRRVDSIPRHVDRETESGNNTVLHVRRHSLRLEGEAELCEDTLKSICKAVDKVIKTGKKQKSKSLLQLLHRSRSDFRGVALFDNYQVQSLHCRKLPNCWSLPVVTLTSIAIALPNIAKDRVKLLVSSVSEGLYCIKIIEKCLYENGDLMKVRKAADIWVGVELFNKWQKMNLSKISLNKNSKETLQELANEGKRIVSEFKRNVKDCLMRNPLNWPAKVIAANSMYRISKTILLAMKGEVNPTDEGLFDELSAMIADILAACFTNLTRVITIKCHKNGIEEREKSVAQAALLLGQTEAILEFLWQRELPPGLDEQQAAYIEEWREVMQLENESPSDPTTHSSGEMGTPETGRDHLEITVMEESFQGFQENRPTLAELLFQCNHVHREQTSNTLAAPAPTVEIAEV